MNIQIIDSSKIIIFEDSSSSIFRELTANSGTYDIIVKSNILNLIKII